MKNTATLGQIQKILSLLEGIPSEQVQEALESGLLANVIRSGELKNQKQQERKMLEKTWALIGRFTGFKSILITVPHDRCEHRSDEGVVYQLRCWEGKYGNPKRGHIDGGDQLFEVMLPEKLDELDWKCTLRNLGINVNDTDTTEWIKEVRESRGGFNYDLITIRFKTPQPQQ